MACHMGAFIIDLRSHQVKAGPISNEASDARYAYFRLDSIDLWDVESLTT
jgi:hypothetical protein